MQLVSKELDIDPDTLKKIFVFKLHQIPPQQLTKNAFG